MLNACFIEWFFLLFSLTSIAQAQGFYPASVPLAIRSPYMSIWHPSTASSPPLSNSWAQLWRQLGGVSSVGYTGKLRIDGQAYAWIGGDGVDKGPANVSNIQITPTRSIFVMQAGPMNITVTFLSPIEPSNWVKQSLPFFYVYLDVASLDGHSHSVQVYFHGSGEILSSNRGNSSIKWNLSTGHSVYHEVELQDPQPFEDIEDQAQDGKTYYAMAIRPDLTWQADDWSITDNQFDGQGRLTDTVNRDFGTIGPTTKAFALVVDLGVIDSTPSPVVWSIGFVRDPVVKYTTPSGSVQQRRPFFSTQYSSISDAIDVFNSDFTAARDRAIALDNKILQDASKISAEYVDLVSLAARQTFGSLDITVANDHNGNPDPSDVKIFMKDIGNSGGTNPVERIFAAFPAFIYLNASIGGALLKPLLESQDSLTTQPYAVQDMGSHYPYAQVVPGTHGSGIEQTGNMLIMMYAHARGSGDGSLLAEHYNLTKRWADYLVGNTLTPTNQQSADAEIVANMTNLALKGIIGVKAMAEISRALGEDLDAQQYDSHASALIGSWTSLALSSDKQHLLGVYNDEQSWSLLYNLYADRLLGTNLVSNSILDGQSQFLSNLLSASQHPYGLPVDSTISQISSAAWTLFTAAVMNADVRDKLVHRVWVRTASNTTDGAFPDLYSNVTGETISGTAGPALGAMFSLLALATPNTTIIVPGKGGAGSGLGNTQNEQNKKLNIGPIVGGVVGGLAVIGIIVGVFFLWKRRNQRKNTGEKLDLVHNAYESSNTAYGAYHDRSSDYVVTPSIQGLVAHSGASGAAGVPFESGTIGTTLRSTGVVTSSALNSSRTPPAAIRPSKAHEAERNMHQYTYTPLVDPALALFNEAFESPVASSREPLSSSRYRSTAASDRSLTTTEVLGLRNEMENLRRVMHEIHAERFEPPPGYC